MDFLATVLVVLAVVLAVVTVVGHGIWVLLARLFGLTRGGTRVDQTPDRLRGRRSCPRCHTALESGKADCHVCGWPRAVGRQTDDGAALVALREQLERLAVSGVFDDETREALLCVIAAQEERASERRATAALQSVHPVAEPVAIEPLATRHSPAPPSAGAVPGDSCQAAPAAAPLSIGERALRYAVSRAAALGSPVENSAQAETQGARAMAGRPAKPREALSRIFATFMEEKNIRWGELVGGLLIVGCSIALVISFWSEIAERPILKFGLLGGVTAALFGIGLYTERRWKIHTTSHGVLVIAALLVPLNFLAIAAFTTQSPPSDLLSLGEEGISLVVFSLLLYLAGRILVPSAPLLMTTGVMIPSVMQLIVRRFADPTSPLVEQYALAAVPVLAYVSNNVGYIARCMPRALPMRSEGLSFAGPGSRPDGGGTIAIGTMHESPARDTSDAQVAGPSALSVRDTPLPARRLAEIEAHRTLIFLGITSVAAIIPVALLAIGVLPLQETLHWLAPLGIPLCIPALLVGLTFWQRLRGMSLVGLQTAGIAVGALGGLGMLGSIGLAWPDPATILPAAISAGLLLAWIAYRFEIPSALVPAGVSVAIAWLVGFHFLRGSVSWTLADYLPLNQALFSTSSGKVFLPLAALFGAIAYGHLRRFRHADARMIAIVAALCGLASVALVVVCGFARPADQENVAWVLGLYASAAIGLALWVDRAVFAWGSTALLLAALIQTFVYRYGVAWQLERPWIVTMLTHGSIAAGLSAFASWPSRYSNANLRRAMLTSALATSAIGAALVALGIATTSPFGLTMYLAWLAMVWLALALLSRSAELLAGAQFAAAAAIFWAVVAAVESQAWYANSARPWLDPWFLQAQGIALGVFCLACDLLRRLLARAMPNEAIAAAPAASVRRMPLRVLRDLLDPRWPAFDEVLENCLVALLILLALYAAWPGAAQELAPIEQARGASAAIRVVPPIESFEIASIPHDHAAGYGAWLLAAVALGALSLGSERFHLIKPKWGALAVALLVSCALIAQRWEGEVAVASALRWISAGLFGAISVFIWLRRESDAVGADGGGVGERELGNRGVRGFRKLLVMLIVLLYVAMGVYVAWQALRVGGLSRDFVDWLPYVLVWVIVAGLVSIVLTRVADAPTRSLNVESLDFRFFSRSISAALTVLAVGPLAVLLTFSLARALDQHPIVGPDFGSWFREIGWSVSYGVPLAVIALTFFGYALRNRSSRFAFSAGLLMNVVATIVVVMRLARSGAGLDASAWINVAQMNAIVAGTVALCWLGAAAIDRRWRRTEPTAPLISGGVEAESYLRPAALLVTQVVLAAALCALFIVPATARIAGGVPLRGTLPNWVEASGGALGWIATGLAISALAWLHWGYTITQRGTAVVVAALVAMSALTVLNRNWGAWAAFNTLLAGSASASWLLPLAARCGQRISTGTRDSRVVVDDAYYWSNPAARFFGVATVGLAFFEYTFQATWWTPAALATIGARNVWIAWHERRRGFVWIASLLAVTAVGIWWVEWGQAIVSPRGSATPFALLHVGTLAVAAMAVVSVWIERTRIDNRWLTTSGGMGRHWIAFHRFAAWLIVAALALAICVGIAADLDGNPLATSAPLTWMAWVAALVTAVACWWDSASRWPVACVYCIGLLAVGLFLDGLDFRVSMFPWALAISLGAYSLATSYLWSRRDRIRATLARLRVPTSTAGVPVASSVGTEPAEEAYDWEGGQGWLVAANLLIGCCVLALVAWIQLNVEGFTQRMTAVYSIGAQSLALALLARGRVQTALRYTALVFGVLFAVAFGWAWLAPDHPAPWLHRMIVSMVALAAMVVVYGFGLVKLLKRENEWSRAAARLVPVLVALAAILFGAVLAIEVRVFMREGEVPISWPALLAVAVALGGLVLAAMVAALVPGRDPLGLSERGRTAYVYGAEVLAGLLFLHIRVTMPWLFSGWFVQFWPMIVMLIAFVGVGLGEVFQRRRQAVLSEPLQATGALLPLLPAIGFWFVTSSVHYSSLLLAIGVLYGAMAVLRRSFWFGILAAISANGSLWYLLYKQQGLGLLEHPQLWLIPPALSALVAGHINRERLSREQSAMLRYLSAIVIYASSTADIFVNGVADAPWLPVVLAGLSILGVFAGIVLRVRAFLYLGASFLVIAITTVIWYAAVEQQRTYILWIAGIVTGLLIIALFGVFEKRRDDVLRLVEELKHWQA